VDATTLALMLRSDAGFRRAAMDDADTVIARLALDVGLLAEAGRLMALGRWHASPAGRQGHAALFALVAAAHRRTDTGAPR
jgi:hypothetical protein